MSTLVKNNNDWVSHLLDDFLGREMMDSRLATKPFAPAVNIKENEDGFGLELLVPGFSRDAINIHLDEHVLTISSEVENESEEEKEGYHKREFVKRSFKRSFKLPKTIEEEAIEATFENGILMVHLPKREEAKPKPARTIAIK